MNSDQLIVQMVLEVTNQQGTPLIAGIYLAGAYSATLSTVAASVNVSFGFSKHYFI